MENGKKKKERFHPKLGKLIESRGGKGEGKKKLKRRPGQCLEAVRARV